MSIVFKRIIIVILLIATIFSLDAISTKSLWLGTPTDVDILNRLLDKRKQEQQIDDIIADSLDRDPDEDYQKLFDNQIRHTFIIEFTSEEFDGLVQDMNDYYSMYESYQSNNYREVKVTYVADDEILVIDNVGLRSKGNSYSRRLPIDENGNHQEIHFMLKFNEIFDLFPETEEYNILKTREFLGLEQILFKWNNVEDPSYINEVYSYEMFTEIGVEVPNASLAEVQIVVDGKLELTSLYKIFEHYDEEFIRRHFNEENVKEVGDLYKGQYSGTLEPIYDSTLYGVRNWEINYRPLYSKETNKDSYSYDNLIRFSLGINNQNTTLRKQFLEENFNIDNFLKVMAMNVLLGNPDDYRGNGNNFYYYFDTDGYMTYIPFDYDNSMYSGWDGMPAFINYTLENDIYEWGHFNYNSFEIPLWDNIIYHEEYQVVYEDYLEEYITSGLFSEESYLEIYNTLEALYGNEFTMTYNKTYYIETKIKNVLKEIDYYRSIR